MDWTPSHRSTATYGSLLALALGVSAAACGSSSGNPATPGEGGTPDAGSAPEGGDDAAAHDATAPDSAGPDGSAGDAGSDATASGPPAPGTSQPICVIGACLDFPPTPIVADPGVPANASSLFGPANNYAPPTAGTPLCVLEPQLGSGMNEGAMIPANWVRPRFRVTAPELNLFEIRITSPWEQYPLVVYTTKPEWYMSKGIWSGTLELDAGLATGTGLGNNAAGAPLTVTVRGLDTTAPGTPVGVSGDFNIAPVALGGSVSFWTASSPSITPTASPIYGFTVGDEGVQASLKLQQLAWAGQPGEDGAELRGYYTPVTGFSEGQVQCMGCHSRTPDGSAMVFTDNYAWMKGAATMPAGANQGGAVPSAFGPTSGDAGTGTVTFGAGAQSIMRTPWWGTQSMSPAHWRAGDAVIVSSYGVSFQGAPPAFTTGASRTQPWQALPSYNMSNPFLDDRVNYHQLAWIDVESAATIDVAFGASPDYGPTLTARQMAATAAKGTTWGLIATGDTMSDVTPAMSNLTATNAIAYVESDFTPDGHPDYTATQASIRVVPYGNHAGGASQPLAGASDSGHLNYDPSYSPDDKFIGFVQAPAPGASSPDGPYYNRFGQVMVVPASGGTAMALSANAPNACAGDNVATGIINSWPKWSPSVVSTASGGHPGKTYYFVVFTSARTYADEFSQQFTLAADPTSSFTGLHTSSQLYLAAIVVDNVTKSVTTFPAVYIWNQNRAPAAGGSTQNLQYTNLTPTWDAVALPPLTILPAQ